MDGHPASDHALHFVGAILGRETAVHLLGNCNPRQFGQEVRLDDLVAPQIQFLSVVRGHDVQRFALPQVILQIVVLHIVCEIYAGSASLLLYAYRLLLGEESHL